MVDLICQGKFSHFRSCCCFKKESCTIPSAIPGPLPNPGLALHARPRSWHLGCAGGTSKGAALAWLSGFSWHDPKCSHPICFCVLFLLLILYVGLGSSPSPQCLLPDPLRRAPALLKQLGQTDRIEQDFHPLGASGGAATPHLSCRFRQLGHQRRRNSSKKRCNGYRSASCLGSLTHHKIGSLTHHGALNCCKGCQHDSTTRGPRPQPCSLTHHESPDHTHNLYPGGVGWGGVGGWGGSNGMIGPRPHDHILRPRGVGCGI